MDLEHTLLAALHQEPTDLACWLALADALEEAGQADRAELLRLRQSLLRPDVPDRPDREERLADLLARGVRPVLPLLVNAIGLELTLVPQGGFWMGSPHGEPGQHHDEVPRHRVELTRPYYLGVYPVTQDQYFQVMQHNPSHFSREGEGADVVAGLDTGRLPVENVSWHDAERFCRRLGELPEEKAAGRAYRLPSEAEWEYACRAGTTTMFSFGDSLTSDRANIDGNLPEGNAKRGEYLARTSAVGAYPPNAFGLHDMHGNVWEWCGDWFAEGYYAKSPRDDPQGPAQGTRRALRGGGWFYGARICRSAYRYRFEPEHQHNDYGLRVVCDAVLASRVA